MSKTDVTKRSRIAAGAEMDAGTLNVTDKIEGSSSEKLSAKNHSLTLIAGGSGVWYIQSNAT